MTNVPRSGGRIRPPRKAKQPAPDECVRAYVMHVNSPVESPHALPPNPGMAGLRRLFDDPAFMADGSSARASLAGKRGLALPGTGARLVCHVGWHGRADRSMAERNVLFDALGLGSICSAICDRHLSVFHCGSALQLGAVGRPARSS